MYKAEKKTDFIVSYRKKKINHYNHQKAIHSFKNTMKFMNIHINKNLQPNVHE